MFFHSRSLGRFTPDQIALAQAFADQAALAIEKARLLQEAETSRQETQLQLEATQQERARLEALNQVSRQLAGAHDTDEVLNLIVNEAERLVGVDGAWIRLVSGQEMVVQASTGSIKFGPNHRIATSPSTSNSTTLASIY